MTPELYVFEGEILSVLAPEYWDISGIQFVFVSGDHSLYLVVFEGGGNLLVPFGGITKCEESKWGDPLLGSCLVSAGKCLQGSVFWELVGVGPGALFSLLPSDSPVYSSESHSALYLLNATKRGHSFESTETTHLQCSVWGCICHRLHVRGRGPGILLLCN